MQCLTLLQVERDHRALDVVTKRRDTSIDPQSALGRYRIYSICAAGLILFFG